MHLNHRIHPEGCRVSYGDPFRHHQRCKLAIAIPLLGNATATPTFALTIDGGAASIITVTSGQPAGYHLSLAPQNGYTGDVILNFTPVHAAQYANCSLLPSSLRLVNGSAQISAATVNTVTETADTAQILRRGPSLALCLLPFGILLFRRGRATLAIALLVSASLFTSGCGSGGTVVIDKGDPNLRYTPPGSYLYQVAATATTGVPLSQTVTLNLTVTAQ